MSSFHAGSPLYGRKEEGEGMGGKSLRGNRNTPDQNRAEEEPSRSPRGGVNIFFSWELKGRDFQERA